MHSDWTKDVTESFPLGNMDFEDVIGYHGDSNNQLKQSMRTCQCKRSQEDVPTVSQEAA